MSAMKRKNRNKQRKIIVLSMVGILCVMSIGYAAFQTNLSLTAKGNIIKKVGPFSPTELKETVVTSGDGLYVDNYVEGRYVYKGANPNNYITFNNELWRILSIENDGTIKIIKASNIGDRVFDSIGYRDDTSNGTGGTYCALSSYGCNAWATNNNFSNGSQSGTVLKEASLNTYLNNDYYNTLNSESQNLIQTHTWGVGAVTSDNTDLAAQIASENGTTWSGNIGLISVSEYLRANTNTQQCGNFNLNNTNYSTCKTTNFIVPTSGYIWTISPRADYASRMFYVSSSGYVGYYSAGSENYGVLPALYLKSDITLSGKGTEEEPYTINS